MSNKKQFEYIDNKIKEAAENMQPVYDASAWEKMETLLDKEEKRRPFFWILTIIAILILGSLGTKYLINTFNNTDTSNQVSIPNQEKKEVKNIVVADQPALNLVDAKLKGSSIQPTNKNQINNNVTKINAAKKSINSGRKQTMKIQNAATATETEEKLIAEISEPESILNDGSENKSTSIELKNQIVLTLKETSDDSSVADKLYTQIPIKDSLLKPVVDKIKKKGIPHHGFYLLAALGPDVGSMHLLSFNNSTVSLKYGIGIGYQFNKRLSVQTGFYAGQKKYVAGPEDYHAKQGSYWTSVQITKVKANCMIYEVPISIRYNWLQKPSSSFYVTIGASSYIMKKENYDYYYYRNSNYYEKEWAYWGNKHVFAVFNFSAGFEKSISNKISILIEPSVSSPITGVGDGSVKLYSSSLLLGIKYQLSKKK